MKLGMIGLGKMGKQILTRLLRDGHEVVVISSKQATLDEAKSEGAITAKDKADLVAHLGAKPVIWLMVPQQVVESELAELYSLMPGGGIIIDGGNSDYRQTMARAKVANEKKVQLVDAGTSGGILGLERGFSIMVGGDDHAIEQLKPVFESLAQPLGWGHFGPAGAGHFVKMVHNAIEYGMMESYAEGYRMLKEDGEFPPFDLAAIGSVWQHGSIIESKLNELAAGIFATNPVLEGVDGFVAESGEARWTLERAKAKGLAMPAIQAAFDVRVDSQNGHVNFATKFLAALRNAFGGHAINKQ